MLIIFLNTQIAAAAARQAAEIIQLGSDNTGTQSTAASFGSFGIQKMWIDQIGDGNTAGQVSIRGTYSEMIISQTGNSNTSTQYQNDMNSKAHAFIIGDGNNTVQYQNSNLWSNLIKNEAFIDILGSDNYADHIS